MDLNRSSRWPSWLRTRFGFAFFYFASLLISWSVLRLVLFSAFNTGSPPLGAGVLTFLVGVFRDGFVAAAETLPLLIWFWVLPEGWFASRFHQRLLLTMGFLCCYVQVFLLFAEFFFFDEFKSRFNTVAVDYLLYPREVFTNIWDSYHVGWILLICLACSLAWTWAAARLFGDMWSIPYSRSTRLLWVSVTCASTLILGLIIDFKGAHVGEERTLNEIANNGSIAFVAAAVTRHLDYAAFYRTLPKSEAYERTRRLLTETNASFVAEPLSVRRRIEGDDHRSKLNLVILLEESLGSEFWGSLGRPGQTLTPQMDRLAKEEGMLFTNLYASGNRTVRGFEGVLSSFPPLPGDSIVKRDLSDNVETIARVLKRDGYATTFLYGGRGIFDGMRSFAMNNGYDRFVEQKHITPTFTTIWGVCDEDLFDRAILELREMSKAEKPFFATVLSVSNHKPYTYPKGKIPENPDDKKREHAVKYSDYALGQFFRAAKKESFWTNTIFAVVADHGARVYGNQSIPIHSYEIPMVVLGPAIVKEPSRIPQLGGSLDVAPTLLGFIGRPYESLFFGRDLMRTPVDAGRAFLNHNRDIGMLVNNRLIVLGLMHTVEFYGGNPKQEEVSLLSQPTDKDREFEKDAIAVYQVADDLYTHQRYRIDQQPESANSRKQAALLARPASQVSEPAGQPRTY